MKNLLRLLTILGLTATAFACGGNKSCTTSSDCGGGANYCDAGVCKSSPGAEIMFEAEEEDPQVGDEQETDQGSEVETQEDVETP